jgi:hypothetical protein
MPKTTTTTKPTKPAGKAQPGPLPPVPANVDALLAPSDVCAALRVKPRTLRKLIAAGDYPKPDLDLAGPRWFRATHEAWMTSKRPQES